MKQIADEMLASAKREFTLNLSELDAEKYPFTYAMWKDTNMVWHFINRKVAKPSGEKLTADKVADVLAKIMQ